MNKVWEKKFDSLYQQHVNALRRQGKAATTIDVYSRAVRRITKFFDRCPDQLSPNDFKIYFDALVKSHSWSTVKVDRNDLQFFYKHVLGAQWNWVDIIKAPQKKVLPDILSVKEVEHLINNARALRHQTFLLTVYSMGLRLGEALNLQVGDIDSQRMKVHVHLGKGRKDRFVTLPLFRRRCAGCGRHSSQPGARSVAYVLTTYLIAAFWVCNFAELPDFVELH